MVGFIKTIFSGLFGVIGLILKLPLLLLQLPAKLLPSSKGKKASSTQKASGAFFLEAEEAQGFTTPTAKSAPAAAASSVAATANALNLPQPTVTTPSSTPEVAYAQFGLRRSPGANMKSYLDMAKTIKNA